MDPSARQPRFQGYAHLLADPNSALDGARAKFDFDNSSSLSAGGALEIVPTYDPVQGSPAEMAPGTKSCGCGSSDSSGKTALEPSWGPKGKALAFELDQTPFIRLGDSPNGKPFRTMTDAEYALASTTSTSSGQTVVVTGARLAQNFTTIGPFHWNAYDYDQGGSGSETEPPCWQGWNEEMKTDSLVDEAAAKVMELIKAQPNQRMEWGAYIYVDNFGNIKSTALTPSADFRTQLNAAEIPLGADGTTDFSRVLAIVHSHPEYVSKQNGLPGYDYMYDPDDSDYLLVPSVRQDSDDDWDSYDRVVSLIQGDGGDASQFSMYIAGFDGISLQLNQYFGNDRNTNTVLTGDYVYQNYTSPLTSGC